MELVTFDEKLNTIIERVYELVSTGEYIERAITLAQRETGFYFTDYIHEEYCRRLIYELVYRLIRKQDRS